MKACQLCGCASWGPIGNPAEMERVLPWKMTDKWTFVRCDNCNSIAREDLLHDAAPTSPPDAEFPGSGFGGFIKTAMPALGALLPPMPAPPTRTERLVCQILQANPRKDPKTPSAFYAQWAVALARVIEWELDHPNGPAATEVTEQSKEPWLVLSFSAREEFECWLTGMWDAINIADRCGFTSTQDFRQKWWDAAVAYVEDKKHGK